MAIKSHTDVEPAQGMDSQDPATRYHEDLLQARQMAERFADGIIEDLQLGTPTHPDRSAAIFELYKFLIARHEPPIEEGDVAAATEDAAYLLGVAVGQRTARRQSA